MPWAPRGATLDPTPPMTPTMHFWVPPPALAALGCLAALLISACSPGEVPQTAPAPAARATQPPPALPALNQPGALAPAELRVLDPQTHDFGKVYEGVPLEHTFSLEVAGRAPLKIVSVHKSCGCTRAEVFVRRGDGSRESLQMNSMVLPGTRLEVQAGLDTLGRTGKQTKPITLYANVPGGQMELVLLADVSSIVAVNPPVLDLGRFVIGAEPAGSVELRAPDGRRLRLATTPENASDELEVQVEAMDPDASGLATRFLVSAQPGPGLQVGVRNFPLTFLTEFDPAGVPAETASKPILRVRVPVTAQVFPLIEARPPSMAFGLLNPGQEAERSVELWAYAEGLNLDLAAATVELSLGGVSLAEHFRPELLPLEHLPTQDPPVLAGYRLRLHTSGLPGGPSGTLAGRLRFPIGRPGQAELVVGVTAVARGQ